MFRTKNQPRIRLLDNRPRINFFAQGGFLTAFTYLTGGVFLSGLAMLMGAGDVLVSYLSVILNICGVLILALTPLLNRFKSRKKVSIVLTALSKVFTLFIVAIPAIFPAGAQLPLFVTSVIIAFTLQAQTTVAVNQWMLGFVDETKKGRYISLRQTLTLVVTVVLALLGGYWMDAMVGNKYLGFVVLFAVAALMSVGELILLMFTPDCEIISLPTQKRRVRDSFLLPLKDRKFIGFVVYILLFYLLLNISDSFTTVYMMKYLALPYQTVTAMNMIISLPQIVLLGVWGKISDKRGANFVLKTSVWLFAGETLFLFFAAPNTWFVFIPLAFAVASVANAGFIVAVFNRRYELMPSDNRISFDNFYTAAIGVGFILGPMIGGAFKDLFAANTAVSDAIPFANIRLLYLISTVGILLLQFALALPRRKKAAEFKQVSWSSNVPLARLTTCDGVTGVGYLTTADDTTVCARLVWEKKFAFSVYCVGLDPSEGDSLVWKGHYQITKGNNIVLQIDCDKMYDYRYREILLTQSPAADTCAPCPSPPCSRCEAVG